MDFIGYLGRRLNMKPSDAAEKLERAMLNYRARRRIRKPPRK
jgi:hypothetical protein